MRVLPIEIVDYILSYCDGYVRADQRCTYLNRKHISVKLKNLVYMNDLIGDKLVLSNYPIWSDTGLERYCTSKKYTNTLIGYTNKTITRDKVSYCWISIIH